MNFIEIFNILAKFKQLFRTTFLIIFFKTNFQLFLHFLLSLDFENIFFKNKNNLISHRSDFNDFLVKIVIGFTFCI